MTTIRPVKTLAVLTLSWFLLLGVFYAFPDIDKSVSRYFFTSAACTATSGSAHCGFFPLSSVAWLENLRMVLFYLPVVLVIMLLASLLVPAWSKRISRPEACPRNRVLLLGVWLLDTGLVVNMLLKAFSGRPRPSDSTIFGGALHFVPAGDFSGACTSNCSFISGEAASAGWIFCLLLLLPARWRKIMFIPTLALSVGTACLRVAFGRHYFSDALLAWLSAFVVLALLASVFGWQQNDVIPQKKT